MIRATLTVAAAFLVLLASHSLAFAQAPTTPFGKCAQELGGERNPHTNKWYPPPEKQAEYEQCVKERTAKRGPGGTKVYLPPCQEYKVSLGGTSYERGGNAKIAHYKKQRACR